MSVAGLEQDIRGWTKHWNENPRPSVWVKTADQILASLARSYERVSAAGAKDASGADRLPGQLPVTP